MTDEIAFLTKRFDEPDEVRTFDKGRYEVIRAGGLVIGRASYEPGWVWSEHVGSKTGEALCQTDHVGLVLSGAVRVKMEDGREIDLVAGDVFAIGPGHDSWVIGDEPYVSLHFQGAEGYAR